MDWITLCVEAIGAVILCVWIVLPIQEFGGIIRRLRVRPEAMEPQAVSQEVLQPQTTSQEAAGE